MAAPIYCATVVVIIVVVVVFVVFVAMHCSLFCLYAFVLYLCICDSYATVTCSFESTYS